MRERLRVAVRGAVQGVGFRPFVYRLAHDIGLSGWVLNSPRGVSIEAEGSHAALEGFLLRLECERPPRAMIHGLEASWLDATGAKGFEIRASELGGETTAVVLPDIAPCEDCRREVEDPRDRRYRYPFTNCTNCGPRFSIMHALPYDRAQTSMRGFTMCAACQREYDDPLNRRFHAQPNACPVCGPQVALWEPDGRVASTQDGALRAAAKAIRAGLVVAVKGIGGFHLMADAANEAAVDRLRERKHRAEKPFALMYPTIERLAEDCELSAAERRLLNSPEAPIVLARRRDAAGIDLAPAIAPDNQYLGVMLPSTPLHHLLLADIGGPVIATSGNLSDEPLCTNEHEALGRLRGIADLFLVHDRPIVRHVDDSIVRVVLGRELMLRRARGYAPLPIPLSPVNGDVPPLLAVGAHLKNTCAVSAGRNAIISQHLGDLETPEAAGVFRAELSSLEALYRVVPETVACDLHPDYLSTRDARAMGLPVVAVQHHYAHVMSCMEENAIDGPALGVSWDGTGLGTDGTIWGGEFLAVTSSGWSRVASLGPFRLPGGESAVREPRRSALGLLHAIGGRHRASLDAFADRAFTVEERRVLLTMLDRGVNAPVTTSAGRLFDAVAALVGLRDRSSFEGQAAMALEFAVHPGVSDAYPFAILTGIERPSIDSWVAPEFVVDWEPAIRALMAEQAAVVPVGAIAARFHTTLAHMIVAVAARAGESRVVLSGGCFQNRWLLERTVECLRRAGFRPYWHQRVPCNDGGIALGQLAAARKVIGASVIGTSDHRHIGSSEHRNIGSSELQMTR